LANVLKITEVAHIFMSLFDDVIMLTKIGWATFWAILSKTHLATLIIYNGRALKVPQTPITCSMPICNCERINVAFGSLMSRLPHVTYQFNLLLE
jgi:hypothetical protein